MTENIRDEYILYGVEEVYDAFDEYEHANSLGEIHVVADNLERALEIGYRVFWEKISKKRMESGYTSRPDSCSGPSGSYFAHIEEVREGNGVVLYSHVVKHD